MAKSCPILCAILALAILMMVSMTQDSSGLVVKLTTRDLTEKANQILIGKVVNLNSRWNPERTKIFTYVTISVKEYIKGASAKKRLTIPVPGGEVGDIRLWVSDTPTFKKGETVLLFLRPEFFQVVGWYQGKYTIKEDMVVEKKVPVEEFVNEIRELLKDEE